MGGPHSAMARPKPPRLRLLLLSSFLALATAQLPPTLNTSELSTCATNVCTNGGSCFVINASFECMCPTGYRGTLCEVREACPDEPCPPGSLCLAGSCRCPQGFTLGASGCVSTIPALPTNPCLSTVCENGGVCLVSELGVGECSCPEGTAGRRCQLITGAPGGNSCNGVICDPGQRCVSRGPLTVCAPTQTNLVIPEAPCAVNPCLNGGSCVEAQDSFLCRCPPGFQGDLCELAGVFDPCSQLPCGVHGACQSDQSGEFYCDCFPGFTGLHCEVNEDDCAGVVCPEPDQVCQDGVRSYTCICPPGGCANSSQAISGPCPPNLCLNSGTCVEETTGPRCLCPPGFNGLRCEEPATQTDPCAGFRSPCRNGGTCISEGGALRCLCPEGTGGERCDGPESACDLFPGVCGPGQCVPDPNPEGFVCSCPAGLQGPRCEEDASNYLLCQEGFTCANGGTCTLTINQYPGFACLCPPGFVGARCEEVDIDECLSAPCHNAGRCLQRSDPNNYRSGLIPGVYSAERQTGFHCLCPEGTRGPTCEERLDPCDPSPCRNGASCRRVQAGFTCQCGRLWEGERCESMRKSCASIPSPCARKTERCLDTFDGPKCLCEPGWGGPDCSFELSGCEKADCGPGTLCTPYLGPQGQQLHTCECPQGRTGVDCSVETVASFDGSSLLAYVTNPPTVSYNLSLAFRTTLSPILIVTGSDILGSEAFSLSLASPQQLTLRWGKQRTALLLPNGTESLTDGEWRKVSLSWSGAALSWSLSAASGHELLEESLSLISKTLPVFTTKFGGSPQSNNPDLSNMVGCLGDMEVNGMIVVPADHIGSSLNVQLGCFHEPQCEVDACSGQGVCRDLWTRAECDCGRPWIGPSCALQLPAATFLHEGSAPDESYAKVELGRAEEEMLELRSDVSLLLRTREEEGTLFYLGSDNYPGFDTFIAAELTNGQLHANIKLGGRAVVRLNGGPRMNDGEVHAIRILRLENDVKGFVDGEEVFSGRLEHPFPHPLLATHFFVGGHPPLAFRVKRQANSPLNPDAFSSRTGFKGVLQDVRVNGRHVPFFPIDKALFPIEGLVSDDTCGEGPCGNGGTCSVTFNDYSCRCIAGWRGKDCQLHDYCAELQSCPQGALCQNTDTGFLCLGPATLETSSSAQLALSEAVPLVGDSLSLRLRTRTTDGSVLYTAAASGAFLLLAIRNGGLDLEYSIGADSSRETNITRSMVANGEWQTLKIQLGPDQSFLMLGEEGESILYLNGRPQEPLGTLFGGGETVIVGAVPGRIAALAPPLFGALPAGIKGCIEDLRIGDTLPAISLLPSSSYGNPKEPHFQPTETRGVQPGCLSEEVCGPDGVVGPCENNARCLDHWNLRECDCMTGFNGELCEMNIDDCVGHNCSAQGRCVDEIAAYTCACQPGYEGRFCERETNECDSGPCQNGATCLDQVAAFQCQCNANYTGDFCEFLITVDCDSSPCMNGATCSDKLLGPEQRRSFECTCRPGYYGRTCDFEVDYCEATPCLGGSTCHSITDQQDYRCACRAGYTGKNCELDIDECAPLPCANGGSCVDGLGNFTCVCRLGWAGLRCEEDVDECLQSPCQDGGVCINSPGDYECDCPQYYLGRHCEVAGSCLTSPCVNGFCQQTQAASHHCECEHGYTGAACESEIDYCESAPCLEGGLCIRQLGGFDCECIPGFTGITCEINIDECEPDPCQHGGICTDGRNAFTCDCFDTGYTGPRCAVDVEECLDRHNCEFGVCRNIPGSYECECHEGFIGRRCAHQDPCASPSHPLNATLNDAPSTASLTAEDPSRVRGRSAACANGGLCHSARVEGPTEAVLFDCDCADGFSGKLCVDQVKQVAPASSGTPLLYIIGPILGIVLLIAIIIFAGFFMVARKKRANRGTYSPSRQEMTGARVPMGPMMKPPPQERLI